MEIIEIILAILLTAMLGVWVTSEYKNAFKTENAPRKRACTCCRQSRWQRARQQKATFARSGIYFDKREKAA